MHTTCNIALADVNSVHTILMGRSPLVGGEVHTRPLLPVCFPERLSIPPRWSWSSVPLQGSLILWVGFRRCVCRRIVACVDCSGLLVCLSDSRRMRVLHLEDANPTKSVPWRRWSRFEFDRIRIWRDWALSYPSGCADTVLSWPDAGAAPASIDGFLARRERAVSGSSPALGASSTEVAFGGLWQRNKENVGSSVRRMAEHSPGLGRGPRDPNLRAWSLD